MKRITILLAVILLFSILPQSTLAFRDTDGTPYEQSVSLLTELGILEGRNADYYEPEKTVSRAEAATILVRLSGGFPAEDPAGFTDVSDAHWAYGYISSAYGMGIIDGMGDGTFAPEAAVSTEQFVKMLLCLAGYKTVAEAQGGYPSGYMIEATKSGITDGVPMEKEASRGNIARMVYNFLDVPVLDRASYGGDSLTFAEGETVLSYFLKIEKYTGMLKADEKHAFKETVRTKSGYVQVGDMLFLSGSADTKACFGMKVAVYAKETEGEEKEIVFITPTTSAKSFALTTAEVQSNTTKTNLIFLRGAKDDAEMFAINAGAKLIQNGTEVEDWTADALYTGNGVLKVISHQGTAADVLVLDTYNTYVVESFSTGSMRIRLKPNSNRKSTIPVKEGDIYKEVFFEDENGQQMEPTSLQEWDVITAFEDTGNQSIRIVFCSQKLSGTVTEIIGETVLRVDEKLYKADEHFFADYDVNLGKTYIFSVDMYGKITAAVETESGNTAYAYAMLLHKEQGFSGKVYIKLLTEKDGVLAFQIAETVRLNDIRMPASHLVEPKEANEAQREEISKLAEDGVIKEQLIIVEKNAENEIVSIETAADGTLLSTDTEREGVFSLDKKNEGGQLIRAGMLCQIASKYYVKDTKIFNVAESYTGDNDDKYFVRDISYLMHGGGYKNFDLYDLDNLNRPEVMVMRAVKNDTDVYTKGEYGVVVNKGKAVAPDGTVCSTLSLWTPDAAQPKLYYDTNEVDAIYKTSVISHPRTDSLGLPETVKLSDIDVGDVVRVTSDSKGVIEKVAVLFRHKTPQVAEKSFKYGVSTPDTDDYHDLLWVYVRVTAAEAGIYKYTNPRERIHTYVEGETLILTFDTKRNKAEKADASVIEPGVLLLSVRGGANEKLIVVYK